jgi:hypothetical protein
MGRPVYFFLLIIRLGNKAWLLLVIEEKEKSPLRAIFLLFFSTQGQRVGALVRITIMVK